VSIFYIVSALLVLIGVVFVVYPWISGTRKQQAEVSNVGVIRARIEEIKREAKEGLINKDEMQQAIDDMKLALVDEVQVTSKVSSNSTVGLLVGGLPALIIGIWVYNDANQLSGLSQLTHALNNTQALNNRIVLQPANDVTPQEFQNYALVIRQQLRNKPDDAIGWVWLGRLNMTLGQMDESIQAFEKALKLKPDDDDVRVKYAQAAMMSGEEEGLDLAFRQLQYLLKKSPDNREYRLLMTVVAAQSNNKEVAFTNFALIRDQLDPNSNLYNSLVTQLRAMGAPEFLLVFDPSRSGSQDSELNAAGSGNTQVSTDELGFAGQGADPDGTKNISLNIEVSISDELLNKLPPTGFLIVFAQDASGNARMPLAVKKVPLPKFPVQMVLSQADAMIANFSLNTAENIMLTARISADQDVMPATGELQGVLQKINLLNIPQQIKLNINKEIL